MPRALPFEENGEVTGYMVFCPACSCGHLFNLKPGNPNGMGGVKPVWRFVNNDAERPTFKDSMLVRDHRGVCHSHVTDGRIEFCADSTHPLKGTAVDLPDFNDMKGAHDASNPV